MSVRGAKLLTLLLAGACGLLLLMALALQLGVGRGYHWLPADADSVAAVGGGSIDRQAFKLPPESTFAETNARPLFNEDRKPTPETAEAGPAAPPSAPLNVSLTGVILTPKVRIAMLHDNVKNDPISVKEGMPLPGDLGGWTLTRINPRSAVFKEAQGQELEVELSTAVANPKAGAPAAKPVGAAPTTATTPAVPTSVWPYANVPPPPEAVAAAKKTAPDAAQAEQMQRRIEERRKQMREEAERQKQQPNPQH